jgi:hypothetical protein
MLPRNIPSRKPPFGIDTARRLAGVARRGPSRSGTGWAIALVVLIAWAAAVAPSGDSSSASGMLSGSVLPGSRAADSVTPSLGVTPSALTKSGSGEFKDLQITVGQTKDLADQNVAVSWKWTDANPGAHATKRNGIGNPVQANYLQIMQCWGDSACSEGWRRARELATTRAP